MPKILTCSYCGTRAALVLDKGRHELVCSSCGAPVHDIQKMSVGDDARPAPKVRDFERVPSKPMKKKKKKKKKKSGARKVMSEVFDILDDIFD